MAETGDQHLQPPPTLEAALGEYRDYGYGLKARLNDVEVLLMTAHDLFAEGYEAINEKLAEAGRPDLVITKSARMEEINQPQRILEDANNFIPNFAIYTGTRETGKLDWKDEPEIEPVSVTDEELLAFRNSPKIQNYEEFVALQETGQYPLFNLHRGSHATKPAFLRMLLIFPEFTKGLVLGMSAPENRRRYGRFEPELFAAYQLMSRLVDVTDYTATHEDGSVNEWHLCA